MLLCRLSHQWLWLPLLLALALPPIGHAADQAREVKLDKEFTTDKADELPEWYIHDGGIRAQVKKLLEREAKLGRIEASVAADLSGRLAKVGREGQKSLWDRLWGFYQIDIAEIADAAGSFVGFVMDEAPAVMNLYWFSARVSRALDETVAKRHALENQYVGALLGPKPDPKSKEKPKTFFDVGDKDRVVTTLRERVLAVRSLRQEKVDSFLLARRAVDRTALPTATFERANDLWLGNTAELQTLEGKLDVAKTHLRDILADRQTKFAVVKYAEKLIADCGSTPEEQARKKSLQQKRLRLQGKLEGAEKAVDDQKTRIDELGKAIAQEKLGYDTKKGGVKKENWSRQKLDELGAAISSGYAELAIRRRILKRVTREADHLYSVADRLSAFRRMQYTAQQRMAIINEAEGWTGKELRAAYLDQGIVSLCRREGRDEDTFMGQLDYALRMVSAARKFGEGLIQKKVDDLNRMAERFDNPAKTSKEELQRQLADLRKELRFFCDEVQHLKDVGGGAFTTFLEQAQSLFVVTGIYEARLEVEKVHERVRDKRKDTGDQIELLKDAFGLGTGQLAAHFGLQGSLEEPWEYDEWKKRKPPGMALRLFHKDKSFHDALDGGLRRIASAGATTRLDRGVAEYLVAYERACYSLRELMDTRDGLLGIDPETGDTDYKMLLSPVRTVVTIGRRIYRRWIPFYGPADLEIEAWVNKRAEQIGGMQMTFALLRKAEFRWVKLEALAKRAKRLWHVELLAEHPEYRRFWQKLRQENYNTEQVALVLRKRQVDVDGSMFQKSAVNGRLERLSVSQPSPEFLAPAHYQAALDQIQLYNYPAALQSLIAANELDPAVVTTDQVDAAEDLFAWWETGGKLGKLASEIADQCVWYLVTQGIMSKVVAPFRQSLAGALKVPLPPPPTQTLAAQFGNVLKGYVNPLRNIVSYETYTRQGLSAALMRMARESTYEVAEAAFREEVLLRQLKMDEAVAMRLAGMLFSVTTQMLDSTVEIGGQAARYKLAEFKMSDTYKMIKNSPMTFLTDVVRAQAKRVKRAVGVNEAVSDAERIKDLEAKRQLVLQAETEQVNATLRKLDDAVTAKKIKPEEAQAKRKWLEARKRLLTQDIDAERLKALMDDLPIDFAQATKMLDEAMPDAQRQKVVDECVELIRMFESSVEDVRSLLKLKKGAGGMGADEFLQKLDTARQVIHRESFNHAARLLRSGTDAELTKFLKDAGVELAGEVTTANLRALLKKIGVITPTGSAGSLHRLKDGEYKAYDSDLDFTILLNLKKGEKIDPGLRTALEAILNRSLDTVGKGIRVKKFDVAYMADEYAKFTAESLDRQGPKQVMDAIEKVARDRTMTPEAKQEKLIELRDQLKNALDTTVADLPHGERYRTAGRLNMLWYLTALGDHFLVFENGQFVKKMKSDPNLPPEAKRFAQSANATLKKWMGWEIILDDLYFAGKKAKGLTDLNPLDQKPFAAAMKEIGKRNIRDLVGAAIHDPGLMKRLNELLDYPSKGKYADHKTFCDEIAKELRTRDVKTNPPLKDLADLIELIGEYKNNPDIEALIKKVGGDSGSPEKVASALNTIMKLQTEMANRFARAANIGLQEHMSPVFVKRQTATEAAAKALDAVEAIREKLAKHPPAAEAEGLRKQLDTAQQQLKSLALEAETKDLFIRNKLLTALAGFKNLGGHLPAAERKGPFNKLHQQLMETLKKTGASRADVEDAFGQIGIKEGYARLIDGVYGPQAKESFIRTFRRRVEMERKRQLEEELRRNRRGSTGSPRPEPVEGRGPVEPPVRPRPRTNAPPKRTGAAPSWLPRPSTVVLVPVLLRGGGIFDAPRRLTKEASTQPTDAGASPPPSRRCATPASHSIGTSEGWKDAERPRSRPPAGAGGRAQGEDAPPTPGAVPRLACPAVRRRLHREGTAGQASRGTAIWARCPFEGLAA